MTDYSVRCRCGTLALGLATAFAGTGALRRLVGLGGTRRSPSIRAFGVGHIEARTLKDDSSSRNKTRERFGTALGAFGRLLAVSYQLFGYGVTRLTSVFVDRHAFLLSWANYTSTYRSCAGVQQAPCPDDNGLVGPGKVELR